MEYRKALEYVENLPNCSFKRYGLGGILKLLERLQNPQNELKYIHIAGTNGKGSVASFCAKSLEKAGFKTGLYISPFVVDFKERIQINGEYISEEEFSSLVLKLSVLVKALNEEEIYLTGFDFVTALAIEYFFEKGCDIVVLEVGMGGRLDSTNVIPCPLAAIITHIDYDHVKELGGDSNFLLNIAKEKAGILKKGGLFICSSNQYDEVLDFFKEEAKRKDMKLILSYKALDFSCDSSGCRFFYNGVLFKTRLLGYNQVENAMVAITALLNLGIDVQYIIKGLKEAFIAARFEILKTNPFIILDGAHNENGIDCLRKNLKIFGTANKIGVFSVLKTKNFDKMLYKISGIFKKLIITKMDHVDVADLGELEQKAKLNNIDFVIERDILKALKKAKDLAEKEDVVVIFGSLYFASQVRKFF